MGVANDLLVCPQCEGGKEDGTRNGSPETFATEAAGIVMINDERSCLSVVVLDCIVYTLPSCLIKIESIEAGNARSKPWMVSWF